MVYLVSDYYEHAYKRLLDGAAEASKEGTGACSVLVLVANDPDALCAARILFSILKHDFITYQMVPVSSYVDVTKCNKQLIEPSPDLRTVILINCGATVDLQEFIKLHDKLTVIVVDSHRPFNLYNIFWNEQILCFDDGDLEKLEELKDAFNFLEFGNSNSSDEESDSENSEEESSLSDNSQVSESGASSRKKQKKERPSDYDAGSYFGQSAAISCFRLIEKLGRPPNLDTTWWAIVGATSQFCLDYIDKEGYMIKASDSSSLDNLSKVAETADISNHATDGRSMSASASANGLDLNFFVDSSTNPEADDSEYDSTKGQHYDSSSFEILSKNSKSIMPRHGIYVSNEFRFFMVRHWSLESSMRYSTFVATRLGTWSSRGKSLFGLMIAKLGLSRNEVGQMYTHLDPKLKSELPERWGRIASDYNLEDASFVSFVRAFGWRAPVSSASDHVWGLVALLSSSPANISGNTITDEDEPASSTTQGETSLDSNSQEKSTEDTNDDESSVSSLEKLEQRSKSQRNWKEGFFLAYDALSESNILSKGFELALKMQTAIVEMGSQMLQSRSVKTLSKFRLAVISNDCVESYVPFLYSPLVMIQLSHFLLDAFRNHSNPDHQSMPFILSVFDPATRSSLVMGIAPPEYLAKYHLQTRQVISTLYSGEVRNRFGLIFEQAASDSGAKILNSYFDASLVLIEERNLQLFLKKLVKHI
ncbi:hypothetical protein BB560_001436 [Smittium megazygosporum]|uniref:Uncharacterized protein n=1 Tax=Smittium megazygosporum TaxID=133381 RepID=A0A2T9ZHK3_9FUNG|nr:hypothetical protein BB560_001436 [Smittium megazygosporum]